MSEYLRKLVNSESFLILQNKLEKWIDDYHYNTCDQNVARGCEIIELNSKIQGQLFKLLNVCAAEGGVYGGASVLKKRLLPLLESGFLSSTSRSIENPIQKKSHIKDVKRLYERSLKDMESELNDTRNENETLRLELDEMKIEMDRQGRQSASDKMFDKHEINDLKNKLDSVKSENFRLKDKALITDSYEKEIENLKEDVAVLTSRHCHHCSHGSCDIHCVYPHCHHDVDPHCHTKEQQLVSKMNDLFSLSRVDAMTTLSRYSDDHENNQKIIFHAVMESFSAAKIAFRTYKSKVRSDLIGHHTGCSLEDSVQHYINHHADHEVDTTCLCRDVVKALDFKVPLIRRPGGLSFDIIGSFIRDVCRIAWSLCGLPNPIDVYHPTTDGELFDEHRYRRSYDSEYTASFVAHHIWPCLVKSGLVISKGEAVTLRAGSARKSPVLGRSASPTKFTGRSPSPTFRSSSPISAYRSKSPVFRKSMF